MGSGKTANARVLSKRHGVPIRSLATAVKNITAHLLRAKTVAQATKILFMYLSPELKQSVLLERNIHNVISYLEDFYLYPVEEGKPRKLYQYVGNGLRVLLSEDIWVELLLPFLGEDFLIDDARYENEARIAELFKPTMIVKLEVTREQQIERMRKLYPSFNESWLMHESEDMVDKVRTDLTVRSDIDSIEEKAELIETEYARFIDSRTKKRK